MTIIRRVLTSRTTTWSINWTLRFLQISPGDMSRPSPYECRPICQQWNVTTGQRGECKRPTTSDRSFTTGHSSCDGYGVCDLRYRHRLLPVTAVSIIAHPCSHLTSAGLVFHSPSSWIVSITSKSSIYLSRKTYVVIPEMWVNAQRDGRHAEYRCRPLFNAAKFGWRPY